VSNPGIPLRRRALLLCLVGIWSTAPLQTPALVIGIGLLANASTNPVSPLIIPIWSLNIAYCVWLYWQGLRVNADASHRRSRSWWEPVLVILLLPLFSLWEAAGVARGSVRFLRRDERTFSVIVKSA
jgi:hypothetical protein